MHSTFFGSGGSTALTLVCRLFRIGLFSVAFARLMPVFFRGIRIGTDGYGWVRRKHTLDLIITFRTNPYKSVQIRTNSNFLSDLSNLSDKANGDAKVRNSPQDNAVRKAHYSRAAQFRYAHLPPCADACLPPGAEGLQM